MGLVLDLVVFGAKFPSLPGAAAMAQYGHAQKVILVQATECAIHGPRVWVTTGILNDFKWVLKRFNGI